MPALETLPPAQQMQFYENSKNAQGGTPLASYKELYDRVELANAQKMGKPDEVVIKQKNEQDNQLFCLKICEFHDPLVMLTGVKWLERSSPITEKFYLMTRDDVSAT